MMASASSPPTPLGYWGVPTATINWCEEDYSHSYYIAEFYNTFSNLIYPLLGVYGLRLIIRFNLESRYIFAFLALISIGLGSACFHATLLFQPQLWDEIPMLWGSLNWLYTIVENQRTRRYKFLPLVLFVSGFGFAWFYVAHPIPLLFQVCWGILTTSCMIVSVPQLHDRMAKKTFAIGFLMFLLGFIAWLIDQHFCPHVERYKLHAAWHVLTCLGSFTLSTSLIYSRLKFVHGLSVSLSFYGPIPSINFVNPKLLSEKEKDHHM